ncbi:hypothetical protein SAMN06265173_1104 [Thalassovita litoralis]|uniref:Bulb-type lectin domain-containing protein n=1 Tax=Thalassovita litoralis TaxID=1010611 RepID=A0A521DAW3_9RHOB|nr:hypothetical protein [Thalassovita litoralis]SMO68803.1 hypothetical protein SAMN06265173_1104 [Thalassovita litoralis]
MFSLHTGNGYGAKWMTPSNDLKNSTAIVALMDKNIVSKHGTWRVAKFLVMEGQGDNNPNVTLRLAIPEEDQIKARMHKVAATTVRGQFYPNEVQNPADLDAMRREISALGNLGRRDPNYRKNNKYASDLSGPTVTSVNGPEKIYHDNPTPLYFNDLVLHPKLNEACQFMAEYYARTNGNTNMPKGRKHDAPGVKWQGAKMDGLGDRLKHFAPGVGSAGEGLAGAGAADSAPTTWMTSETHYRPWFSIDYHVKSMGIGAAKTDRGWYFCKIGGTELPDGVTQAAVQPKPQPVAKPEPKPVVMPTAQPAPVLTETPADARTYVGHIGKNQYMTKDNPYHSNGMGMYLMHQSDGNLVIKRASDHMFVWGLNEQPGVDYQKADKVAFTGDRLVVYDTNMKEIWSTATPSPSLSDIEMMLSEDGTLIVFSDDVDGPPVWASRKAIWTYDGIQPGQELQRGTRVFAVRNQDKIPTMAGKGRVHGEQLYSFLNRYMELQGDGNFVIKGARAEMPYVWGLDQAAGLNLADIDRMRMNEDGRLIALSKSGAELWSVPQSSAVPVPGSLLNLSLDGTLQIVSPGFQQVVWQNR